MNTAMITFEDVSSRIVNTIKGQYGLKNKSQAVNLIVKQYANELMELELRPEFVKRLDASMKRKGIPFKNMDDLRNIIQNA